MQIDSIGPHSDDGEGGSVPPVDTGADPGRLPAIYLDGVRLHSITEARCVRHIVEELEGARGGWVVTHNLDHLRRLRVDRSFAELAAGASVAVADGMPLLWACALRGKPLPERVAGSNLIWSLSQAAATRRQSVYLLGGDPGTAEAAAAVLAETYPGLRIAGHSCPDVGFDRDSTRLDRVVAEVAATAADIVYVALGSPKQEQFIDHARSALPKAWWLGIGISFSFVCGAVERAPEWMQEKGLEWAHRLAQEPRRLSRRYLVDGLPFAARLLTVSAVKRRPVAGDG